VIKKYLFSFKASATIKKIFLQKIYIYFYKKKIYIYIVPSPFRYFVYRSRF